MKAVVAAFNQEKALVGAFSVIVQLHRLIDLRHYFITFNVTPLLLPQGEERRIVLGPRLAWGEQGLGDLVPANSSVVIDVKIDKVERDLVFNFLNQISSGNFNNGK